MAAAGSHLNQTLDHKRTGETGKLSALAHAGAAVRRRKYANVPTVVNGIEFDSKKEAKRYEDLLWMEKAGQITNLEARKEKLHYPLIVDGVKIGVYTPDFRYDNLITHMMVVEDVKSPASRTEAYRLRKKLMWALWAIDVQEV